MGNIIYDADDEEPNCGCCDHVCDEYECDKYCGPDNWWTGYQRTERKITNDESIRVIRIN